MKVSEEELAEARADERWAAFARDAEEYARATTDLDGVPVGRPTRTEQHA